MYFKLDDSILSNQTTGADVTVIVDYFDCGGGQDLHLEYDGVNGAYTHHSKAFVFSKSNTWRSARFEISDARFGNRQNGGADFRLRSFGPNYNLSIARVRVILPEFENPVFYQDANYGGIVSQTLPIGNYTAAQLSAKGILANWASSAKVPFPRTITMYSEDNFTGNSWVLTDDTPNFTTLSPNANEQMMSCRVQ